MTRNLKERENLEDLGENVKLLYVTRHSGQSKHNLILQINVSTSDVSRHHVDYKNVQKEADVKSCTDCYKSRTLKSSDY